MSPTRLSASLTREPRSVLATSPSRSGSSTFSRHRHTRQQVERLEDHADGAVAMTRELHGIHRAQFAAEDENGSRSRAVESRKQIQQSGFAGSGGAQQSDKLALANLQRDPVDGPNRGAAHLVVARKRIGPNRDATVLFRNTHIIQSTVNEREESLGEIAAPEELSPRTDTLSSMPRLDVASLDQRPEFTRACVRAEVSGQNAIARGQGRPRFARLGRGSNHYVLDARMDFRPLTISLTVAS